MDQEKLHDHIFKTYTHLRIGMALTALAFPLILLLGGLSIGVEQQGSMSAYYHTPMRNAFVGILFMIGPFLFLYKGFSRQENHALNFAGIFAVGIAVFPNGYLHGNAVFDKLSDHGRTYKSCGTGYQHAAQWPLRTWRFIYDRCLLLLHALPVCPAPIQRISAIAAALNTARYRLYRVIYFYPNCM